MAKNIQLSNLDVAKRQLSMAVRLFFNSQDVVCTHVLVSNSHDVLKKLCKKHKIRAFIGDMDLDMVRPEKRKEFGSMMRKAQNYFKHVSETEEIFEFHYEITQYFIWDACRLYQLLTSELVPEFSLFSVWFNYSHTDIMVLSKEQRIEMEKIKSSIEHKTLKDWWAILPYIDEFTKK